MTNAYTEKQRATITKRQLEIYQFIRKCIKNGMPPTIREIGAEFDIGSPNGVICTTEALEEKGYIKIDRKKARSIRLTDKIPEGEETAMNHHDQNQHYWVGHDEAVRNLCWKIGEILDGKDSGAGVASEPWETVRRRLIALVKGEAR